MLVGKLSIQIVIRRLQNSPVRGWNSCDHAWLNGGGGEEIPDIIFGIFKNCRRLSKFDCTCSTVHHIEQLSAPNPDYPSLSVTPKRKCKYGEGWGKMGRKWVGVYTSFFFSLSLPLICSLGKKFRQVTIFGSPVFLSFFPHPPESLHKF